MGNLQGNVVRRALGHCRSHFIYAAAFSGLINLLYLAPSIFMLQVYDRVVPTQGTATLVLLFAILTFTLLVLTALDGARMRLLQRASVRLERVAGGALLNGVLAADASAPPARFQALRDFETLRGILAGPAIIALFDAPWAPIYILVSFLLHPWLGMLALLSAALMTAIAWAGERSSQQAVRVANARATEVNRLQDFSVRAAEVVRALGMRQAVVTRHLGERAGLIALQGEISRRSGNYLACTKFLRLLLQSAGLAVGAWLAVNQMISAGSIFAASLILGRALQPIEQMLAALKNFLSARGAYQNLDAFLAEADAGRPRTALPPLQGRLAVVSSTLRVPGSDRCILSNISFSAEPGELIAVVGPSGSGKSTLLRLLVGAVVPDAGEVRVDGALYNDWDADRLGRQIGYVPQDPILFPGSIKENICRLSCFREQTDAGIDEKVVEAAHQAGAHDIILRLPRGYDTDLRSGDTMLSAGQRQLIALARAFYDAPKMIVLDEPNAHLDSDTEARLIASLDALKRQQSTIVVSTHRSALLQIADKILVLSEGTVRAFGTREEILRVESPISPPGRSSDAGAAGPSPTAAAA